MGTVEEIRAALEGFDLGAAAELLDRYLSTQDDPELRLVRGQLAYLFADFDVARRHFEASLETFRAGGEMNRAGFVASWLGRLFFDGIGNQVAGRAWLARARRMVADLEPCVEQGWVVLATVGCSVADAGALQRDARLALDIARRFSDPDLEAKALADGGLALVSAGHIGEGLGWIDEAMAMATGERGVSPAVKSQVVCSLFTACERTGDLARAQAWMQVLTEAGMFGPRQPAMGLAHCSNACGLLLTEAGRWTEAEALLSQAAAIGGRGVYFTRLNTVVALAELRLRQGRLDEAEALLLGHDDRVEALRPWARLHLARRDFELAAAVARRGLRLLGQDRVRAAGLLAVLVEAELGRGDLEAAADAAAAMERMAGESESVAARAEAAFARARVDAASGREEEAISLLCATLAEIAGSDIPLVSAKLHLELARLQANHNQAAARADARAVAAIHARLDAPIAGEDVALLRTLGVDGSDQRPTAMLSRQGDKWTVRVGTTSAQLRDTKGLRYLAELISCSPVERHVLNLVDVAEGTPADPGLQRRHLGDAGELLDATAKGAYRRRIEDLRAEVEAALDVGDDDRAARADAEIDALVTELSRAVGLGGRDRRAASAAERARLNVTRALRAAIARVAEVQPVAGASLDRAVRTGLYCAYEPSPEDEVVWSTGPGAQMFTSA
jgi:tetratricopeptide (TPR) repeat protein